MVKAVGSGAGAAGTVAALVLALMAASAAAAFDPVVEEQNYSKTQERQNIYLTPQYQVQLAQVSMQNEQDSLLIQATDPERSFQDDVCARGDSGCAGDARLYDWQSHGYGIVRSVLYTARNGATISGHVWATRAGPPRRPGIVITNGSVQADEQLYWYVAQALAKAGYVVLTWDPQGQGQSDTYGESPDQNEGAPAQSDGRPFFDGTEDAINFFLSTPQHPYEPESSCSSGTTHAPKQDRRVRSGLDSGYDPFWQLLDPSRIGIAGHSYGAAGVSYIGQWDPRVKAIVAWDNLSQPSPGTNSGSFPPGEAGCPAHPTDRTPARITKPALGMTADYFLPPAPNTQQPDPYGCQSPQTTTNANNYGCKVYESQQYSKAGVDTGAIVIRGGSHLDFSFIPFPPTYTPGPPFGATLRGADEVAWYTTAWFDKYVKGDPTADARLLSNRWRHDGEEGAVDPTHDGNVFSFYYPSRLEFHRANGTLYDCEHLREGCPGLSDNDGYPGEYSYIALDRSPDIPTPATPGAAGAGGAAASGIFPCASQQAHTFRLHRVRGRRIVRVRVSVGGRLLLRRTGRSLRTVTIPGLPGTAARTIVITTHTRRGLARRTRRTVQGCGALTPPATVKLHSRRGRRSRG